MADEKHKAQSEIAKAASKGIEATQQLGQFVSRVIGEPLDNAVGIVGDKLKYMRWERQLRLMDRCNEMLAQRRIEGKTRSVAPKFAIPVIENASMEEDDELQDLWARLLTSSLDPSFSGELRNAFIDILKQLETTDVYLLSLLHSSYVLHVKKFGESSPASPSGVGFDSKELREHLGLDVVVYENCADNLMRVRCVASQVIKTDSFRVGNESMTIDKGYDALCITSLGLAFVEACISQAE